MDIGRALLLLSKWIILPRSTDKEKARREFILNILLVASIILASIAFIVNIINSIVYSLDYHGESPLVTGSVSAFLCFLLLMSRLGKSRFSAITLVLLLSTLGMYTNYRWGADLPQALLLYALIIIMAGILIETKFAFIITALTGLTILLLAWLEINNLHIADYSWKTHVVRLGGAIVYVITLGIIATISWLSNREISKALKRAWRSEAALKRQRDKLEITVEKRTKQLRQTQAEKVAQLYRFAEFGKSATGLFHDLANPLTLISLNLNKLSGKRRQPKLAAAEIALERAIIGTKRLESFVQAARKQVQDQEVSQIFLLKDEINQAIQMLEHKARKLHVTIFFQPSEDIKTFGNPVKFNQLITNLLSNAIDAYERIKGKKKIVEVRVNRINNNIKLEIQDWGCGISQKDLPKIFDPLFTTKNIEKGTGIGLSICKDIIEKGFEGKYSVESKEGLGTNFTVEFPIKKSKYAKPNN